MEGKGKTFAKGGCGCIVIFLGVAALAVLAGGRAHIDIGGALLLFIVGGVMALIARAIYGGRDISS